jgi:CheY-like chemotaxis protein
VKHRIAIVEDNPDNRLLLCALFQGRYELKEYANGKEARAGLDSDWPDLVLLDIGLPDCDGRDILREIRMQPKGKNLPVLALTAHAMIEDRKKFLEDGFSAYFSKPIEDLDELVRRVDEFLA